MALLETNLRISDTIIRFYVFYVFWILLISGLLTGGGSAHKLLKSRHRLFVTYAKWFKTQLNKRYNSEAAVSDCSLEQPAWNN